MGATNCPETPRQKMIQMMYLVYTAMLALNVSAEILNAFVVVDDTLAISTRNATQQNFADYNWFDQQKTILGEAKVKDAYTKAQALKKETDQMVKYIEQMRQDLIFYVDGDTLVEVKNEQGKKEKVTATVATMKSKENFDKPTDYMINKKHGFELADKIREYKKKILALAKPEDQKRLSDAMGLDVDQKFVKEGAVQSWAEHNFDHIITAAAVTLLNKEIGEVRNAESQMLTYLKASISADDFKFDKVSGRSIPKSQMVFSGDPYEADIIVAAYDSKTNPEVWYKMGADTLTEEGLGSATKLEGENGLVKLKIGTGGTGEQKYAGLIKVVGPNGEAKYYGFKDKYTVLTPSATIAADKMNVLYAGIPNPVSVSGPVAADKLSVSFPGCSASSTGAGKYNVSVPESMVGKTVQATVAARVGESTKTLGSTTFRVKRVPTPRAALGTIRGGKQPKQLLLSNPMRASMGEDFVYDLNWSVTSFQVVLVVKGMEDAPIACQGSQLNDRAKAAIQKAPSGTVVYFQGIKASSQAGSRNLDDFAVRIR